MDFRLLIVDKDHGTRALLEKHLSEEGLFIETAEDGDAAMRILNETPFDLTLIDVQDPGFSGLALLQRIRSHDDEANVMVMHAEGTVEEAVKAMKLGAIDFVQKPLDIDAVRSAVDRIRRREVRMSIRQYGFEQLLEHARNCIRDRQLDQAEEALGQAVSKNPHSAEPHNLLGVIVELRGRFDEAGKHYRAACSLDPTYKPSDRNLMRLTDYNYSPRGIDLGEHGSEDGVNHVHHHHRLWPHGSHSGNGTGQ